MSALLAQPRSLAWRIATVAELIRETHEAVTIVFDVQDWPGHVAGQHVDIRLTAPDGYQTQRSYSISSPSMSTSVRYGETSPSSIFSTVMPSRPSSGPDEIE